MENYHNIDPERTGKFIKVLRKSHNLTQEKLGEILFVTRKAVSKWETGRACPSIDTLKKMSESLGVSLEDIIEGDFEKLEALLKKNDNVVYRTVHSEGFKVSGRFAWMFIVFVLILFFISNFNATKVYSLSYEDDTFSLDNGIIVFSNIRSYLNLGTFYSNEVGISRSNSYKFELYLVNGDEETFIIESNVDRTVDIPRKLKRLLKKYLSTKSGKLVLRLVRPDNSETTNLDLVVLEKADLRTSEAKDGFFNDRVFGHYSDNLLMDKDNSAIVGDRKDSVTDEIADSTDLNFLYNNDIKELKTIFDNRSIKIEGTTFKIRFNEVSSVFSVYNDSDRIEFRFDNPSIKVNSNPSYILNADYTLPSKRFDEDIDDYKMILAVINALSKVENATFGSVFR